MVGEGIGSHPWGAPWHGVPWQGRRLWIDRIEPHYDRRRRMGGVGSSWQRNWGKLG